MGRWAALHPLRVVTVWAVLLVLAVFSAGNFAARITAQSQLVDGSDSAAANQLITAAFPGAAAETDFVVLHSDTLAAEHSEFRALVASALGRYRDAPAVDEVTSPYAEAFGSLVAAAIPLALGVIAILASFGLLGIMALFLQFTTITRSSVAMLAIALGIDYSLFIVTRFREELVATSTHGRIDRADAVGRALATAGHAVLFSGTTVLMSLAGLFLVHTPNVRAMAVGMMVGVLAMMALSVTLLPALLGLLGNRVNSLALP